MTVRETTERVKDVPERHPAIKRVIVAYQRMSARNGSQYAGAITFFSFLALFPLILLVASVTGFVLASHPAAQQSLLAHITHNVPGDLGNNLSNSVQTAIRARGGVGAVGVLGLLLTGLGWIANLRAAVNVMWGVQPPKRNIVAAKFSDLVVFGALGLGLLVSLGVTAVGTALTGTLLRATGLDTVSWLSPVVRLVGILVALAGDFVIFWWLQSQLPSTTVPRSAGVRGALLSAVGFEVLKVVGTFTIARSASNPTLGPFAGLLAVLVWIQLVTRFLLFAVSWTATLSEEITPAVAEPVAAPVVVRPVETPHSGSLLALGALLGAAITKWWTSPRLVVAPSSSLQPGSSPPPASAPPPPSPVGSRSRSGR